MFRRCFLCLAGPFASMGPGPRHDLVAVIAGFSYLITGFEGPLLAFFLFLTLSFTLSFSYFPSHLTYFHSYIVYIYSSRSQICLGNRYVIYKVCNTHKYMYIKKNFPYLKLSFNFILHPVYNFNSKLFLWFEHIMFKY